MTKQHRREQSELAAERAKNKRLADMIVAFADGQAWAGPTRKAQEWIAPLFAEAEAIRRGDRT